MKLKKLQWRSGAIFSATLAIAICSLVAGAILYNLPPPGGASWRTLAAIANASSVEAFRCGQEPRFYRWSPPRIALGMLDGFYVYERGPVMRRATARELSTLLQDPRNRSSEVIPISDASPLVFRAMSGSGSVDVLISPYYPGAQVIARDADGRIVENDGIRFADRTGELSRIASEAFPAMRIDDDYPIQIRVHSGKAVRK